MNANDIRLANLLEDFGDHLIKFIVPVFDAFIAANGPDPDLFISAFGDGSKRHSCLFDETGGGRVVDRHFEIQLHFGGGG